MNPETHAKPSIDRIMAYEQGDLSLPDMFRLFSDLIKSGMAWTLQGHYGRTAQNLIDNGYLTSKGELAEAALATIEQHEFEAEARKAGYDVVADPACDEDHDPTNPLCTCTWTVA